MLLLFEAHLKQRVWYVLLLQLFLPRLIQATPVVDIAFYGFLGNNLWQYCVGKIIAEELGLKCYCPAIYGFPGTYMCPSNVPLQQYYTEVIRGDIFIDIPLIIKNRRPRNIRLEGFFQQYQYLQRYTDKIRNEWLRIDENIRCEPQHPDDVVVHVRCGEFGTQYPGCVQFDYYKQALSSISYRRLIICTDEPKHPFIKNFAPYNPIIHSTKSLTDILKTGCSNNELTKINMQEFCYMLSFNKMILSYSTFAWWVGFLSHAQEVYMPYPDGTTNYYSYGKIQEDRFHYISTKVGR